MKIYTSYFYMVRFFKPNMIPLSTAKWDPKWYHENLDQSHRFVDKRGVLNGLRAPMLAPDSSCDNYCTNCTVKDPTRCEFIKAYDKLLSRVDYDDLMHRMEVLGQKLKSRMHFDGEPVIVLLLHEAPSNPCSERGSLHRWFLSHGTNVTELRKEDIACI